MTNARSPALTILAEVLSALLAQNLLQRVQPNLEMPRAVCPATVNVQTSQANVDNAKNGEEAGTLSKPTIEAGASKTGQDKVDASGKKVTPGKEDASK